MFTNEAILVSANKEASTDREEGVGLMATGSSSDLSRGKGYIKNSEEIGS